MKLPIKTTSSKEVVDITEDVAAHADGSGVMNIFAQHTTCAVAIGDLDPGGTDQDYLNAYTAMVPKLKFNHPHDPKHMPDHILSTLIGQTISVPVENGQLQLGQWQRIILFEFDGPRTRSVILKMAS